MRQAVFHVVDDAGSAVSDYVLEFYGDIHDEKDEWATVFNEKIQQKVHVYGDDSSYRSFLINVTQLFKTIDGIGESLKFSLSAVPDIAKADSLVGYRSFGVDDIDQVELNRNDLEQYFCPDRTLLVTITLPRYQKAELYRLRQLES